MKTQDIASSTPLLPEVIASTLTCDPCEESWLAERAERLFQNNARFRSKVKGRGNSGRDYLRMFMAHWLEGLRLAMNQRSLRQLERLNWKHGLPTT